ncbi:hypothetical protein ACIQWA_06605 [Kitasatospora sp. NPDC098652]|uniref:hypothetical protein n=1 Tax=Kitasatospora sp. NPDC098652 TaxID=3364095 RepID=UPI0037FCD5D1
MASPTGDTTAGPDLEQPGPDARLPTEAITGLRRALRSSGRAELPSETLPVAQVEILRPRPGHGPPRSGISPSGCALLRTPSRAC